MTSQRHTKKEGSHRELFVKTPAKKLLPDEPPVLEDGETVPQEVQGGRDAPLTRSFMEQLFGTLRRDFATLKQEIAAEVKEMKQEVVELGQWIDTQAQGALEEELDCHRRELLTLQDKNQELQYQIEDLENREAQHGQGVERNLTSVPLARVPSVASEMLDGDITIEEVLAALQRLPMGKAPGADGFSAEYYKAFGLQQRRC
ncbi:hypothetical protein NDU88_003221 [Pleurodeles waltl]|uniref:Uncharacterized protein n=1 Tax=Pleurodeles waltl TaxID=8319 RepID=A0AAV7VCR7_PLEWA|nr:hypothetical protein NDU88_003221 [Pleurodeles waltl]